MKTLFIILSLGFGISAYSQCSAWDGTVVSVFELVDSSEKNMAPYISRASRLPDENFTRKEILRQDDDGMNECYVKVFFAQHKECNLIENLETVDKERLYVMANNKNIDNFYTAFFHLYRKFSDFPKYVASYKIKIDFNIYNKPSIIVNVPSSNIFHISTCTVSYNKF